MVLVVSCNHYYTLHTTVRRYMRKKNFYSSTSSTLRGRLASYYEGTSS